MLESIFRTAGWRTGLYTSPHLIRLGERAQVNRCALSESEIVGYVRELQPVVAAQENERARNSGPSYFEFMTGMALLHFARCHCEISVVEVGLGGRLDATNVVTPELSVITSIGFDHCEMLGNTLGEIATEKAGIIKSGHAVVIGRLPAEAEEVIRQIAGQRGSRVYSVAEEFGIDAEQYPKTNLDGAFQSMNAATAALVARIMPSQWNLSNQVIAQGLRAVDWPGRWQRFTVGGRVVILDSSHNQEGAAALETNLISVTHEFGRAPIIVAGVLGIDRARPLVEVFCRHAHEIHFVQPAQRRACTFEQLETSIPASFERQPVRNTVEQLFPSAGVCTAGAPGDVVVVTGSIYLAGEVLARIDPTRGPYEGHLQDF
jgi:dihydrofolate synthase/folylpolyglutamate synthase